jgi:ComB4 competence protein
VILGEEVSDHGNAAANRIARKHKRRISKSYHIENYLVFYMSAKNVDGNPIMVASEGYRREQIQWKKNINKLSRYVAEMMKGLKEYNPEKLLHDNTDKSPLLSFWSYLINGGHDVLSSRYSDNLNRRLCVSTLNINEREGVIRHVYHGKQRYSAILALNGYPEASPYNVFGDLFYLEGNFNVVQHVFPLVQQDVRNSLERHENIMSSIPKNSYHARVEQCEAALNLLETKEVKFLDHSFRIQVYGDTEKELENTILALQSELRTKGIELIQEAYNLTASYWSQYPSYYNLAKGRSSYITTLNLASFVSFPSSEIGMSENPWGKEPITTFKSVSGSHYHMNFHAKKTSDARGHTLVIGGAGKGKTTLIQYLLMNCLKYRGEEERQTLRMLLFDSLSGCRVFTEAFNGSYIDSASEQLQLNPMQLSETPRNKEFLARFLSILAGGVNEEEEKKIMQAVNMGYKTPEEYRSLHSISNMFKPKGRYKDGSPSLYSRLEKYLPDATDPTTSKSNYGLKFNAPKDSLSFDKRIVGFDMTELLRSSHQSYAGGEGLLIPTAAYIFHAFSSYVEENSCPHIAFIDEMWKYLESEQFSFFITEAYKEWRKRNGVIIGAVQDPAAVLKSSAMDAIINNTENFVLFPQPNASEKEYKEVIGLNQAEFDWIRKGSVGHQVMIKRNGGHSVILDIDLGFLKDDLFLFSSQKEHVDLIKKCQKEEPENWVDLYLERAGA